MLRKDDFAVIEALNKRDVYLKDIAAELEVHPRTVKRALQRSGAPDGLGWPHRCARQPLQCSCPVGGAVSGSADRTGWIASGFPGGPTGGQPLAEEQTGGLEHVQGTPI